LDHLDLLIRQHDFAGKGMHKVVGVVLQSDNRCFRALALLPLHLIVNWPIFGV